MITDFLGSWQAIFSISLVLLFLLFHRKLKKNFIDAIDSEERTKFIALSVTFFLIIGVYWMLRSMKDAFITELVGVGYIRQVKIISPFAFVIALLLYNKLIGSFRRHRLFFVVCSIYALAFSLMGYFYAYPFPVSESPLVAWIPGRALGWIAYIVIESFGGLVVNALFWSFVSNTTTTISAKQGYPLIFLAGQIGSLLGPGFVVGFSESIGFDGLFYTASVIIMLIPVAIEWLMSHTTKEVMQSDEGAVHHVKKKAGMWEGLRLIATHPYLMGIGVIAVAHEIIEVIIDFPFKVLAADAYQGAKMASFLGYFGVANASIATLFSIVGTSFIVRKVGPKRGVLIYPILLGIVVSVIWVSPTLYTYFAAMIVIKSLCYSLNNPVKEMLYLPTSEDIKYRAKSFIDGFGAKAFKGGGSALNILLSNNIIFYGSLVSLGTVGLWIIVAVAVGKRYEKLIEQHEIVE
jgi:ATP:ADP antiporter, AAA family